MLRRQTEFLSGWGEIESYLRLSRKTILKLSFPISKMGGTVAACKTELDAHRQTGKMRESLGKSGKFWEGAPNPIDIT